MTYYESAIDEIAGRLQGTDALLTSSIAEILAAALQELIEAGLTGTIAADDGERTPTRTAHSRDATAPCRRHLGDRALARPRERGDDPDLPARPPCAQGASNRRVTPPNSIPGRYKPLDTSLAFLDSL